ncbi:hypothetical protein [Streptomyces albidochromogenes]|uniref:Uncharacterized protein n=1 Tax=Streptomyces albidochromogenes TaxID=329524 RepID=A0ABW6FHA9_9ACTN
MGEERVVIKLTRDQALVLSDWLYEAMFTSDDLSSIVRDRSVWSAIYAISGTLDTTLSEIFMPDYSERLAAAKQRLLEALGGEEEEAPAPAVSED